MSITTRGWGSAPITTLGWGSVGVLVVVTGFGEADELRGAFRVADLEGAKLLARELRGAMREAGIRGAKVRAFELRGDSKPGPELEGI